jgi:hypothetical protein
MAGLRDVEGDLNEHEEDIYTGLNDDVTGEVLYQEDATAGGMHIIDTDEYIDEISIEGNDSEVRNPVDRGDSKFYDEDEYYAEDEDEL